MKKLLLILCAFFPFSANAGALENCLSKIATQDTEWNSDLFDKTKGVFGFLGDKDELTDEIVQDKKEKIYILLAKKITEKCPSDIILIAKQKGRGIIPFSHNNKEYVFDFDVQKVFNYTNAQLGFIVVKNKNLSRNDILKVSDIPNKSKFFNSSCSAQNARIVIPDDTAVNVAGQAVFSEFGGDKNEFYLDYAEGDNRRAFPGLVIMDQSLSPVESMVIYQSLPIALERYEQFGEKLKSSACSNQNLALYLVSIEADKTSKTFSAWNWLHIVLSTPTFYMVSPVINKLNSVKIVEGPYPL